MKTKNEHKTHALITNIICSQSAHFYFERNFERSYLYVLYYTDEN